jgi:MFS family permease
MDRRRVMLAVSFAAIVVAVALALAAVPLPPVQDALAALPGGHATAYVVLAGLLGAFIFPLYGLCVAHTNDFVGVQDFVEASGGLMLIYGLGAVVGPLLAAAFMQASGGGALFVFIAAVHVALGLFLVYRMRGRAAIPAERRPEFVAAPALRATPAAVALDPRAQEKPVEDAA